VIRVFLHKNTAGQNSLVGRVFSHQIKHCWKKIENALWDAIDTGVLPAKLVQLSGGQK
jgi:hypothetical protein